MYKRQDYCSANPEIGQKYLTVYENGDTICLNQCMFLYLDLSDNTHVISQFITILDSNGNTIFTNTISTETYTEAGVLQIAAGICQIKPILDAAGFTQYDDIGEILFISINNQSDPAQVKSATLQLSVKCCDKNEQFQFANSLGTYDVISTNQLSSAQFVSNREFIKTCQPCAGDVSSKRSRTIKSETYRQLTVYIDPTCVPEKVLCEFFDSRDVYWKFQEDWYWIEPLDSSYIDLTDCKDRLIPYNFKIHSKNNLKGC